jgi:hypothetical protein
VGIGYGAWNDYLGVILYLVEQPETSLASRTPTSSGRVPACLVTDPLADR